MTSRRSRRRLIAITLATGASAVLLLGAAPQRNAGDADVSSLASLRWVPLGPPDADLSSLVVDDTFPYRVCGVDRTRRAICVTRWPEGETAPLSTLPFTGGTIAPDPSDADVVYGGRLDRFDRRTGQLVPVAPPQAFDGRTSDAARVAFAPDGRTLYFATDLLWKSTTAGQTWTVASPTLTRGAPDAAIAALAFSPLDGRTIWVGTSDGRVQVTRDTGAGWSDVTPPGARGGVADLAASHFDANSAYVVMRSDSPADAAIWRTRDGGASWTAIVDGLDGRPARTLTEDRFRRGLLFVATDDGLAVSLDDGGRWQSLQLNLPPGAIRDVIVNDADLIAATDGRGLWVLPDISALRQMTPDVLAADMFLFRPATAWRFGASPQDGDSAAAASPGAVFYYLIGPDGGGRVTLEIIATASGELLRRFSSDAPAGSDDWIDPAPGLHRKVWNLRYASPVSAGNGRPPGARVLPGTYQVRLTTTARAVRQAISIRMDPRLRVSPADLEAHATLAREVDAARRALAGAIASGAGPGSGIDPARAADLDRVAAELDAVARMLDQFDGRPTAAAEAAATAAVHAADRVLAPAR